MPPACGGALRTTAKSQWLLLVAATMVVARLLASSNSMSFARIGWHANCIHQVSAGHDIARAVTLCLLVGRRTRRSRGETAKGGGRGTAGDDARGCEAMEKRGKKPGRTREEVGIEGSEEPSRGT
eukprot:545582-Rhodomonas_salina.6